MFKAGLLSKYGIKLPIGHQCTKVHLTIVGSDGKQHIIETITNPKRLEKSANKMHGVQLKPVFEPVNGDSI